MTEAYIVDAVRTPIGKKNGGLAGVQHFHLGMTDFVSRFRPAQTTQKRRAIVSALTARQTALEHRPVKGHDAAHQGEPRQ